ncbi:MAG TPA: hypothetical protein VH089_17990 [Streptosporangiaceae bacterium]|nr:hypothetical protein [Streptosporangiaceae bacterium]
MTLSDPAPVLGETLGSVEDHRKDAPARGAPHFDIVGQLRCGSLEVRGPRRKLRGR